MDKIMEIVAGMMALAARTAPKAIGADFIEIKILTGADIKKLAGEMEKYGREKGKRNYDRDGDNVRRSSAVLLLSLSGSGTLVGRLRRLRFQIVPRDERGNGRRLRFCRPGMQLAHSRSGHCTRIGSQDGFSLQRRQPDHVPHRSSRP